MKPTRVYYVLMLLFGIAGIIGLTAIDYYQVRAATLARNQRWVNRISGMIAAERGSLTGWIDQFSVESATFRDIAASRRDVAALVMSDLKTHQTLHWTRPSMKADVEPLDPRLVVLELQALENHKTLTGPIIFLNKEPFATVIRPLDKHRVLIGFLDAYRLWYLLHDETALWNVQTSIYDYDKHLLFSSEDPTLPSEALDHTIQRVRTKVPSGIVALPQSMAMKWLSTFHYDPTSDWIFILTQSAPWVYTPVILFIVCLIGLVLIVRIPYKAAEGVRRGAMSHALMKFSSRVDGYIRGHDIMLPDPPGEFKELALIATTVRWLIPQWKKAEAFPRELALERKLLALLVESLPEGILFFNGQGGLQVSNELGRVFLGMEQEGREARMVSGVQVPRGFLESFLEPVFTGEQSNVGKEVEVTWADGKHLYRIWVERVEADPGKAGGFIVVIRDITFRKQWEYVQEQMLSGITHDLRGPLSAVMGYLDLMKRVLGDTAPAKVNEYLHLARESSVRLSQMVTDILDVVRFEQGKIDMTIESIPVVEIFQRLKNTFGVLAEQKKINLKLGIVGDATVKTTADRKLLERVLDNLVGNAIKFTPPSGEIIVSAKSEKDRVIFDVVDTGRGIPREAQSRIFDKFQQVRPGDRSSGYGLGLAVAKFIIDAHKGEIHVESEVGSGSHFTFWLPNRAPSDKSAQGDDTELTQSILPPDSPQAA